MATKKTHKPTPKNQKTKKSSQKSAGNPTKYIICGVIGVAVLGVAGYLIFALANQPERVSKAKIDDLAKHYYEEVFYPAMTASSEYPGDPAVALGKYTETGLSPMTLEQLYFTTDDAATRTYLKEHCDTNSTIIKFYPESPYSATDYHLDIQYSCNF